MSHPQQPMMQYQQPAPPPAPENGLGTAGFVLGLLGLLFSFIPIIGVIAWPLVILGLILGLVGLSKANKGQANNKGLAIAGITLSAVGLVVSILWAAVFTKAASDATDAIADLEAQANKESVLVYEITGDAPSATVSYSTFSDSGSSTNDEDVTSFPWTKEFTVKGLFSGGTLTVMTGAEGGTVTCKITVDGVEKKTATGTGAHALASCSNF
ncbi:MmpS family transport accessory protein [Saccharothrix sp. NRRL B-16314]|uniref:MmpS family transport accessory protein n=1 Tax=Saccharothrix sp. NRRL B-16314 TaxID=1463825 RepID=UPI0006893A49|nr:MmpS family transport accessory protein [Saccharothrix sp. NRRL B-16314]